MESEKVLLGDGGEPRPDECTCKPGDDLPCFDCFIEGFDDAAPAGVDDA